MKIQEIRKIAINKGIRAKSSKKAELIRLIQKSEGNFDCFGKAFAGYCDQSQCLWQEDCLLVCK